ncbi:hypothetical protein [Aureimonas mangrovi]|uniref:hypothetical protein n=1 Tax=Aureimonas mangrovi TaxID=2758041 RepID=UPI00163DA28E|nr:hypothetical protein [Aureimonas mangrovi]
MSNIEPNIIDPGKGTPPPPDSLPDPDHVGDDTVREPPDPDLPPIDPDPEEGGNDLPDDIERAGRSLNAR